MASTRLYTGLNGPFLPIRVFTANQQQAASPAGSLGRGQPQSRGRGLRCTSMRMLGAPSRARRLPKSGHGESTLPVSRSSGRGPRRWHLVSKCVLSAAAPVPSMPSRALPSRAVPVHATGGPCHALRCRANPGLAAPCQRRAQPCRALSGGLLGAACSRPRRGRSARVAVLAL